MPRALLAAIVLAGILAGVAAAYFLRRDGSAPPALEQAVLLQEARPLPEFALMDQAGGRFDPARLRGHWTFLFFGFVNCPDVCPTTLATLATVTRSLADLPADERPAVAFVSVDPGRDTPDVLGRYVAHFDPSFAGVTGSAAAIDELTRAIGVAVIIGPPAADGSYSVDHSASIFLVDPEARAAALFGMPHEAAAMARDYRRIVAARRPG
jgi:protein SCO1/2